MLVVDGKGKIFDDRRKSDKKVDSDRRKDNSQKSKSKKK